MDVTLKGLTETDRTNVITELDKCLNEQTAVQYEVSKLARNKLLYKLTYAEEDPSEIE